MKKWAAAFVMVLPLLTLRDESRSQIRDCTLSSLKQIFALVAGAVIAIVFAIYIATKWKIYS
jgi:hypothetical protein